MPTSTSSTGNPTRTGAPIATPADSTLRRLLALDAATCAAMGVALMTAAGPVAAAPALPEPLLFLAGAVVMPIAAFMALVALREQVPAVGALLVVAGNALWAAASLGIIVAGLVVPNALGLALVIAQALAVTVLAGLEYRALRLAGPAIA